MDGDGDVDSSGDGYGRGLVCGVFGTKLIHCVRWLGWRWFKIYISADNSSDDGGDGRDRGCIGVEDAEDTNHENTYFEDGADGNDEVDGDVVGGDCEIDFGMRRGALSCRRGAVCFSTRPAKWFG